MINNIKTNKKPLKILLISYGYDNLFQKSPSDYIAKLERDRLEPQSNSFFQFTWSSKSYYEERNDRLKTAHVKTIFKNFKPLTDFLAIFLVPHHIKKHNFKPDAVLIYDLGFVPVARLIKYIYGSKIVLGMLNMPSAYSAVRKYGLIKSWYSALLEKLFLRSADAYYTINGAMKSYLIKLGAPIDKIKIFSSNTISRDQENIALSRPGRVRLKYNIKDDEKIILSIGRLEAEKGYHELLELFSQLDKKFILIILGRGSFLKELTVLAEKLHISKRVIFAGYANRQEIWDYYKDADLFILLSKVEALGLVFWEAMYMGVPVIGSTATGIVETIGRDGERGLIYDKSQDNIDDLKEKINFCLLESERKKIILDKARKYVEEQIANDLTINDIVFTPLNPGGTRSVFDGVKLIYFTPKRFKFFSADNAYVLRLAESFKKILGKNFIFVFISKPKDLLNNYNIINLNFKLFGDAKYLSFYLTYVYFLIWTPFFLISRKIKDKDNVFFLGDIKLLTILVLWKKILRYDYKICSDWHMYYNTRMSRLVACNSNSLITTSEKLKNLIITKTKVDPMKIKTVYGGTDLFNYETIDKIEARKKLNLPIDKKLIGYIGLFKTMGMEKGIDIMMKALNFLDKSVAMVFVGARAGEVEAYKKMAIGLKVEDRCIIIEKKKLNEVFVYQEAMDILAIPYPDKPHFRDYGFPMKVYDYMASKRPIIYSRLGLVEEVIADYGYSFTPDNPDDFANNLKKIFSDYDEAEIKAGKAFEAVKEFSWDKKAEKIINFIK